MYEHNLTALRNGILDIDIEIDEQQYWDELNDDGNITDSVSVTVTWAATTDSEAWMTVRHDGLVYPAFGGTGTTDRELDEYAEQAVEIWRGVTGDSETTCRYARRDDEPGRPIDA